MMASHHHSHIKKNSRTQVRSPSTSAQAMTLGRKGHNACRGGIQPNKKTSKKQSNESVKSPKRKGVGLSFTPCLVVNPFSSSSSSSSSSPMPIRQRDKGSKGSSPRRPGPSSPGTDTPNLKVYDPTSDLKFAWGDFKKLKSLTSSQQLCPRQGIFPQDLSAV